MINKKIILSILVLIMLVLTGSSSARIDLTGTSGGVGGGSGADGYAGATGHPHNQDLNTTSNVIFARLEGNGTALWWLNWNNLTNVPAGFADGIDNVGSADGYAGPIGHPHNQDLNTTDDVNFNTVTSVFFGDGGNLTNVSYNFSATYTIAKSGGDYTSIQAALDDHPETKTAFIVYPGTYTDTIHFTANNQVVFGAAHPPNTIVTQADANIVNVSDYTSCVIKNLNIRLTAPDSNDVDMITVGDGHLVVVDCKLYLSCSANIPGAYQPHIACIYGSGLYKQKRGEFEYFHSGDTTNGIKAAYDVTGTGDMKILLPCLSNVTNSGTALATTLFVDDGAGTIEIVNICEGRVEDKNASIVTGMGYIGGGTGEVEISYSHLHVIGGNTGNVYAIYHTSSGEVRSSHNKFHIYSTGADRHSFFIGVGDTLTSQFDDIVAPDGAVGAGTLIQVNSPEDGSLIASNNITAGAFFGDGGNLTNISTGKEFASFYLTTGGLSAIGAGENTLVINATSINSDSSIFYLNNNEVTVNKTGYFQITGDCYWNTGGSSRSEYTIWLEKNGVDVLGTRSGIYARGYDTGSTGTFTIITNATSGDVFKIQIQRTLGSASTGYQDDYGTRLTLLEV